MVKIANQVQTGAESLLGGDMDDLRWDAPRSEMLGDADVVTFGSNRPPRWRAPRWLIPVSAIAVGLVAGSGVTYAALAGPSPKPHKPVPGTVAVNHPETLHAQMRVGPFQPLPAPQDPHMTYRTWCDVELLPAKSPHGGRVITTIVLSNTGNVGMTYLVTGSWRVASDVQVQQSRTQAVSPGMVAHVQIVLPVTRAEARANQSFGSGERCSTQVELTATFRDPTS